MGAKKAHMFFSSNFWACVPLFLLFISTRLLTTRAVHKEFLWSLSEAHDPLLRISNRYAVNTGLWRGNVNPGSEWGLGLKERTVAEMLRGYGYSTHMASFPLFVEIDLDKWSWRTTLSKDCYVYRSLYFQIIISMPPFLISALKCKLFNLIYLSSRHLTGGEVACWYPYLGPHAC